VQYPHNCLVQSAAELGVVGLLAFLAIWIIFLVRTLRWKSAPGEEDSSATQTQDDGKPESERPFMIIAGCVTLAFMLAIIIINQPFEGFLTSIEKGLATALAAAAIWAAVFTACAFWRIGGNGPILNAALATGALGFFLHCQFDFAIYAHAVNQACWVALALALATNGGVFPERKRVSRAARAVLILVGFGAILFYVLGPMSLALREDGAIASGPEGSYGALVKAEQANPLNAETRRNLAGAYYELWLETKRPEFAEQAIGEMREAIRLNPNYFRYHVDAAIMLQNMNRQSEALEEYNSAVECYPAKPSLRVYRAALEDALGKKEQARSDLEETARLLRENRMPDGSVRHTTLELDTKQGLPGGESEAKMYERLREH
jgi:tetratricopeptide (TPR) repeat protein